ncbi:FRAS1-related extracellular matrix protein 2-like [Tachypleus tridentatus]|uniref:FRAS1-related extracellular matrix protein 2-like n=1 Tax=Tachypleus tridentatus TaxID=6853 RepID=UPI003FD22A65
MKLSIDLPILNADDLDVPKDTLTFRIKNKPKHGKIVIQLATGDEIIDSFTLDQISHGSNIMYEHDDSETKEDEFELEVTDGLHNTSKKIKVMIYPVDDETPRLAINDGLEISKGEGKLVTNRLLKAEDIDTDDSNIIFVIRQPPRHGDFLLLDPVFRLPSLNLTKGTNFTQGDIDEELIMYVHTGREGVRDLVKFDVTDGRNSYVDRYFWISVEGVDQIYPDVINKGVELPEGGRVTLTTDVLSTSDLNSEDEYLTFIITRDPTRGHLESTDNPGIPVTSFTQMELAGNKIYYVHTDGEETKMDSFEFEVTDGYNSVFRTFRISISDVDNKKPIVFVNKLRILENGKRLITPFELKVEDRDTDDKKLKLTITQVPVHGKILYNNLYPITVFTMEDLRENRISYHHDGSESEEDNFSFTVTDGTHVGFYVYPDTAKETRRPQTVDIEIVPVDNNVPQVVVNRGASSIGPLNNGQLGYRFSNKVLRAEDSDSLDIVIQYIITVPPKYGVIINKALGNESISNFTQGDINGMVIYYILDDLVNATSDIFHFKVLDEGANELPDQEFRLNWAWISLEYDTYEVNETTKYLKVKLFRRGYLGETSFIGIKTNNITAKRGEDFGKHYAEQVQFSPGQTEAYWKLRITDDSLFENGEEFEIVLEEPIMAAVEYPNKAIITILDDEDVSTVEFPEPEYVVNENVGEVLVPVKRNGDLSKEMMIICSTEAGSATGTIPASIRSFSDFISRPESHKSAIRFNQGEDLKYCRLVIIDDSLYEDDESFKIRLSQPLGGKVGVQNVTKVIISPDKRDVPFFYFGEPEYYVDESDGYVEVKVWRTGTDLSKPASVTVRSKPSDPPSAEAGNDYVGIGKTLNFPPGATLETFRLTILDDLGQPILEGPETFELVLRMPINAELGKPSQAVVTINDSLSDLPSMQFRDTEYIALENDGKVTAYIVRNGDLGHVSTVHCYTRQDTAKVTEDYIERPNTNESLVVFEPGDREKSCTVILVNDSFHEQEEIFRLRLGSPSSETAGGALVGPKNVTKITIKDYGDKPVIKFEKNRYNVKEPRQPDDVAVVEVPVIRRGDLSKTSHVRVHTKDGSAKSGKDYVPFSRELEFGQNVSRIIVEIEILYDEDKEHREALTLHLRPDRDMIADIEDSKVIIYIQEVNIVADVTFPFEPMVVSLKDYDDAASASSSPIPGYPVVCVTSCNPKHPDYDRTGTLCSSEGINDNLTEFRWRVAAPSGHDGVTNELKNIESRTFFTGTHDITLDSIYFAPGSRVQCIARAVNQDGDPGLELESTIVVISHYGGLCSPRIEGSTGAEPFTARMRYTGPDDQDYPNLIKLTIVIPHRDGMLPAISTQPLSNFELTLSPDSLRVGTHKCSNLIDYQEVRTKHGFLTNDTKNPNVIGEVEPYQYSSDLRTDPTLRFYRNLDLEACMWEFTVYYDMSELVTDCGGTITSDGQVLNLVQSFVSVRVPLYVSYIFHSPVATGGWQHNDLTSHLRLTFVYDTAILWKNGIGAPEESQLQGNLYPTSMRIREDGRLVVNFRTEPRFKGQFVLSHPGSGLTSMVMSQDQPELTFTLELIRSEPTYAQPEQQWEFVSDLAVRDYSGNYHVKLIPCTATDTMEYSYPLECNPRDPIVFDLQIRFQQVTDPVPAEFSLNTHFHLMRKKTLWLSDGSMGFGEDSDVSFVPGDTVYGRIMVDPVQNLGGSFYMTIEKCFLCTGEDGYIPKYNPDNNEYGCVAESPNLLHTFKIIDRGSPSTVKNHFRNVSFNAVLAVDDVEPEVANLKNQPGADGFRFDSSPLFQVSSGTQWFVHCIYTVRSEKNAARGIGKRSVLYDSLQNADNALSRHKRASRDVDGVGKDGLGTNMNRVVLKYSRHSGITAEEGALDEFGVYQGGANKEKNGAGLPLIPIIVGVACSLMVIIIVACVLVRRKWNSEDKFPPSHAATVVASNGQTRLVAPPYNITDADNTEV